MSREAFEQAWLARFPQSGKYLAMRDGEYFIPDAVNAWRWFNIGYQAAQQWIPYKEGDSLDEGEYYVTIRANSGQIYARHKWFRWGDWNGLEQYETVTHVIQLPTPFVPEVSND